MRRIMLTISLALAWTSFLAGQTAKAPPVTLVRLNFPPEIPSEPIQIMYVFAGDSGAQGSILGSVKDRTFVEISVPAIENRATELKVAAYMPGCEDVRLRIPLENSSVHDLSCRPIGTRRLHGRIVNASSLGDAPARVDVIYPTDWMCRFFQLADCMTPLIYALGAEVRNGDSTMKCFDTFTFGMS